MPQRVPGGNWSPTIVRPEPPTFNSQALRLQSINQDASELSTLSAVDAVRLEPASKRSAIQGPGTECQEDGEIGQEVSPGSGSIDHRGKSCAL